MIRSGAKLGVLACMAAVAFAAATPASAQECKPEDIFAVIDETGAQLRELNTQAQPRIRGKLKELAALKGWSDAELETQGRGVMVDPATQSFDQRAADLLAGLDRLAEDAQSGANVCDKLQQARAKSKELVAATAARTDHAVAQIEAAMRPASATVATAPPPAAPPAPPATTPREPAVKQAAAPPPAPKAKRPPASTWETQTVVDANPPGSPLPVPVILPPQPDPGALGFTPEEIRAAGRGIFGNISASLASVIDFAFQTYGKPTGYVLGDEGGGAFFAGLRYGEGRLVTKSAGERKVYWQGPSAGWDFGLAGSRVMFLVYSIDDHEQLFQRFTGVDGSAYLLGGVGLTLMKRGKVILAPIRTGLGLRVGANVGYLKFTPTPSLNPF